MTYFHWPAAGAGTVDSSNTGKGLGRLYAWLYRTSFLARLIAITDLKTLDWRRLLCCMVECQAEAGIYRGEGGREGREGGEGRREGRGGGGEGGWGGGGGG